MLSISIQRLQTTGIHCAGKTCKKNTAYHINIIGKVWYIKVDSPVAIVDLGVAREFYCRDCIDDLFKYTKTKLDAKLWAFH